MLAKNLILQLHYRPVPREPGSLPGTPAHPFSLKLTPTTACWSVEQYYSRDNKGYTHYLGNRTVTERMFHLIGAHSEEEMPQEIDRLIGEAVSIGRISLGQEFALDHDFTIPEKEIAREQQTFTSQTLRMDAALEQAYLGNTTDYPIFLSR